MKYAYYDNSFGWLKRVIVDKNGLGFMFDVSGMNYYYIL